jgi:hypothetical protein
MARRAGVESALRNAEYGSDVGSMAQGGVVVS